MELAYKLLDDGITGRLKGNQTKQKELNENQLTSTKINGRF